MDAARLTWPEAESLTGSVAVVPLGSIEQHGPHLPVDTDSVVAAAVTRHAVRRLAAEGVPVAAYPLVPYGASGEHADFAGTVSIGTAALATMLVELGRSLVGPHRGVVFASGHGGNADALRAAAEVLDAESRDVATWTPEAAGGDAHAGFTETSIMLALEPGLVRPHTAVTGERRPLAEIMADLRAGGVAAVSPTGVLGDPRAATAQEGERMLGLLVDDLAAVVRGMVD